VNQKKNRECPTQSFEGEDRGETEKLCGLGIEKRNYLIPRESTTTFLLGGRETKGTRPGRRRNQRLGIQLGVSEGPPAEKPLPGDLATSTPTGDSTKGALADGGGVDRNF